MANQLLLPNFARLRRIPGKGHYAVWGCSKSLI